MGPRHSPWDRGKRPNLNMCSAGARSRLTRSFPFFLAFVTIRSLIAVHVLCRSRRPRSPPPLAALQASVPPTSWPPWLSSRLSFTFARPRHFWPRDPRRLLPVGKAHSRRRHDSIGNAFPKAEAKGVLHIAHRFRIWKIHFSAFPLLLLPSLMFWLLPFPTT
jgi:hypothetical protein